MSFLRAIFAGGSVLDPPTRDWNDERMWDNASAGRIAGGRFYSTLAGLRVSPDLAFSVSCVFQGVRLIAEPMGRFKPILYRRLGRQTDAGKERATEHPLWPFLMFAANGWQTASRFRVVMSARAVLWGNAYAELRATDDAAIGEALPLDPDRVQVEQLANSRMRYRVTDDDGTPRTLTQEQIFHVPGFGLHKFLGAELLWYARQSVSLWLAQEEYEATYFRQGARPSLWMKVPGQLSDPAYDRLKSDVSERHQGVRNMHRVMIAEQGAEFHEFGFTAKESQMTEAREAQVHEIARWLNIPVHMLRATQQPTYASAEMFNREYYDLTLAPWFDTWETEIGRQLLGDEAASGEIFAEFLLDALLRANTGERAQAQRLYVDGGILSVNEVRSMENRNPIAGEQYDKPHRAANIGGGGDPLTSRNEPDVTPTRQPSAPKQPREPDEDDEDARALVGAVADGFATGRLRMIAAANADALVAREVTALRAKAPRYAHDADAWGSWLATFYTEHGEQIAKRLQIGPRAVTAYCERHRAAVLAGGLGVLDGWDGDEAAALVRLATGDT